MFMGWWTSNSIRILKQYRHHNLWKNYLFLKEMFHFIPNKKMKKIFVKLFSKTFFKQTNKNKQCSDTDRSSWSTVRVGPLLSVESCLQ